MTAPDLSTIAAGLSDMQKRLSKGQRAFFRAVADSSGGIFHRSVVEPIEGLPYGRPGGLVSWVGRHRLVGMNGLAARDFVLTDEGRQYLREVGR